jgi:hypothetical protein
MAKLVHVEQLMSDDDHNKVHIPPTTCLHPGHFVHPPTHTVV